eukprot:TRINITY_DN13103_c0_g2_i1.p1 TRINITY_DN13103_c0_g2~~TRINITY_DN13103_c0_g2_i1.p1  ORF type:complete len:693 (+),score=145.05 TRINITY_DN13103_c0_g2_i1:243-2321(+)
MGGVLGTSKEKVEDGKYQAVPTRDSYADALELYSQPSEDLLGYADQGRSPSFAASVADGRGGGSSPSAPAAAALLALPSTEAGRPRGAFGFEDLPRACCVFRRGLRSNPEVTLRVGPLAGRVTATSAVILVEVDCASDSLCDCTINFARVSEPPPPPAGSTWVAAPPLAAAPLESMRFDAEGSVSVSLSMEPRRPYVVEAQGLRPASGYVVMVSGVTASDVQRAVRFRTLPSRVRRMRIVAVSGHVPPSKPLGAGGPWMRLARLLRGGPDPVLTLHLGSTADIATSGATAARELYGLTSYREGARQDVVLRCRAALRQAFCDAWGRHEGVRRFLSEAGAQLPLFAPPVAPGLAGVSDHGHNAETAVLLQEALETSREYQRRLWCPDSADKVACAYRDYNEPPTGDLELASSEPVKIGVVGGSTAPDPSAGAAEQEEFSVASGSLPVKPTGPPEEWHFHKYGRVRVLALDTKGSALDAGFTTLAGGEPAAAAAAARKSAAERGSSSEAAPMLSKLQWDALAAALRDESTCVLVVASDVPFFLKEDGMNIGDVVDPLQARPWQARLPELTRLLAMLFDWMDARYPAREVLLLSGSLGFGTTGDVRDSRLGLCIPVVAVGPTLGGVRRPKGEEVQLNNSLPGGRFSFAHRAPSPHWNSCVVDIDCGAFGSGARPALDVQLVETAVPEGLYEENIV